MKKIKDFFKTTFIGGIGVLLPILLTYVVFKWLLNTLIGFLHPLTKAIIVKTSIQSTIAVILAVIIIVTLCFILGLFIKTRLGKFLFPLIEKRILKVAPGYKLFKETTKQFLSVEKKPFKKIALVKIFANDTQCTAFVTDEHKDGSYTVFVPSALNPTTGLICHLQKDFVTIVDISPEEAMRTIISCGAGSSKIFERLITT